MIELNKIYEGDALRLLKTFPDECVNCCVTSPPYYGLRAYGTNPVIWDGNDNCDHKFTEEVKKGINGGECVLNGAGKAMTEARYTPDSKHGFCVKCGAWRGELGSEPTPELFVKHIVDIFCEVKRVLKKDGTLWLNLGDSYAGSGQGAGTTIPTAKQASNKGTNYMTTENHKSKLIKIQGLKPKDLIGIPWMVAFALRADGWYLRQDIIWHKPNPIPESVTDRCTKSHEDIFLLAKSQRYYFDYEAIQEEANYDGRKDIIMKGSDKYKDGKYLQNGNANSLSVKGRERWKFKDTNSTFGNRDGQLDGLHSEKVWSPQMKNLQDKGQPNHSFHKSRADGTPDDIYAVRNKRDVWTVNTKPYSEAHFATFPEKLIADMIKAGCPEGGIVLDPFAGSNTTGVVARKLNRNFISIELKPKYIEIGNRRTYNEIGLFL